MGEIIRIYNNTTTPLTAKKLNQEKRVEVSTNFRIFGYVFIASLGLFCNGIFVGWSSQTNGMLPDTFSPRKKTWITSSLALGAAISPLIASKIWKKIGIRSCILISALSMVIAAPMLAFSECYWSLFTGRFIGGIALGVLHLFVPIYIQDISSASNRKTFMCASQTQFAAGILAIYATGLFHSFLLSSITAATIPLIFMISFYFIVPESPRYHCVKDNVKCARDILAKFKEVNVNVEQSIRMWCNGDESKTNELSILYCGTFSARLLITVFGLIIFEQLIGGIALFFYMEKVLTLTGGDYSPDITAIVCLIAFITAIIFPNFYGQKCKPKSVLLWSIGLMSLCLFSLGAYCHYMATFKIYRDFDSTELPMYLIGAFYFFFALGPYRLMWFYVEKMLPEESYLPIRCWLISVNWLLICGITRILPGLIDFIGVGWLFWYMTIMCWFTVAFVAVLVPKFKTMSDEDHRLFSNSESVSENDA